jgi:hypothetical protein
MRNSPLQPGANLRPRKNKPWTADADERLKALASGASVTRAATIFQTSINAIRERARMLGTPFPTLIEARRKLREKLRKKL